MKHHVEEWAETVVCIPCQSSRQTFHEELNADLIAQTYQDFSIITVWDKCPIGFAKRLCVVTALSYSPKFIATLDDDDRIDPTYLEKCVNHLKENENLDWVFTWGNLFGDRTGYIHGSIEPFEKLIKVNNRLSPLVAHSNCFSQACYNPRTTWAEDLELWIVWDYYGFVGEVIKEELYYRRWHEQNMCGTSR